MSEKKKSLGKKLLDLVSEELPSNTESSSTTSVIPEKYYNIPETQSSYKTPPVAVTETAQVSAPVTSTGNAKDDKYEAQIRSAIRTADMPGPDYLEFSDTYRVMVKKLGEDDAIQMTMEVLKPQGLSKEKILSSAEHYLQVLESERLHFSESVFAHVQNKIEAPKKELQDLENSNSNIKKQLEELQKQLSANNFAIERKQKEVAEAQANIEVKKQKFDYTLQCIVDEIKTTTAKIKSMAV